MQDSKAQQRSRFLLAHYTKQQNAAAPQICAGSLINKEATYRHIRRGAAEGSLKTK